jgi:hypothetical protein
MLWWMYVIWKFYLPILITFAYQICAPDAVITEKEVINLWENINL